MLDDKDNSDEVGGSGLVSTAFVSEVDKSADKDWETFQEAFEETSEMWEEMIAAYLESLESPEKEKEEAKEKEEEKELENEEEEEKEGKEEEHKEKEEKHESHVEVESGEDLSDEKKAAKEAAKVLKSHDVHLSQDSGEHKPTNVSAKPHHENNKEFEH